MLLDFCRGCRKKKILRPEKCLKCDTFRNCEKKKKILKKVKKIQKRVLKKKFQRSFPVSGSLVSGHHGHELVEVDGAASVLVYLVNNL